MAEILLKIAINNIMLKLHIKDTNNNLLHPYLHFRFMLVILLTLTTRKRRKIHIGNNAFLEVQILIIRC